MKRTIAMASMAMITAAMMGCAKDDMHTPDPVIPADTTLHYSNDTLRKHGLTLIYKDLSGGIDSSLRKRMIDVFFGVYPRLMNDFNTNAATTVYFTIDPAYSGVAETAGGRVRYSAAYMNNYPKDIDVVTHEIMHIVQAYPSGDPFWVTEGIADYVRYVYGVDNAGAGWAWPNYNASQSYTDAYRITARFFYWLERKVKPGLIRSLDASMRNEAYDAAFWTQETGKSVDQLWADYGADPSLD